MTKGYFHPAEENIPIIPITIGWGDSVTVSHLVLDTGFSGDLKMNEEIASQLGIKADGVEKVLNMNGEEVSAPVALAYAEIEGEKMPVSILLLKGMELAGIGLFTKFGQKVTVDCLNRMVQLEKVDHDEAFDE